MGMLAENCEIEGVKRVWGWFKVKMINSTQTLFVMTYSAPGCSNLS